MNTPLLKLSKAEIFQFAVQATYIPEKDCLDKLDPFFTYLPDKENPVPTVFPGGDLGYIAMISASGQAYGFEVQLNRVVDTLIKVRNGLSNLTLQESSNLDNHLSYLPFLSGVTMDDDSLAEIQNLYVRISKETTIGKRDKRLLESAIVRVKGENALYPQTTLNINGNEREVSILVYHQTCMDRQNKLFSNLLLEENAITLYDGYDSSYLYDAFSEMSDLCLYSSIEELSKKLPLYTVSFTEDVSFQVIEE